MAKKIKIDNTKQKLVTPEFRVSYPHVFKATSMDGKNPKFSITMLYKKTQDLSALQLAVKHAKIALFGPDKEDWPKMASPFKNGDSPENADKDGYKGHWAVKASSNENARPGVVNYPECDPITDPTEFYAGCYARASVFARVWEFPLNSGLYGIHFILDHVQKMKEGKPFGGKKSAKEAFGALASMADEDLDDEESF